MRFGPAPRRAAPREAIVPMINVVFLLLIFFLMSATVAAPPPFDLSLPEGAAETEAEGGQALYLGADGALAYGAVRGEAVFAAIAARDEAEPLELRADAGLPAADLARILGRLAELGAGEARLVLVRP